MNENQFKQLSSDLRILAVNIPLQWGSVECNQIDDKIDMFKIDSYTELESKLCGLSDMHRNYLRRRWYLWKCSQCDEYLFYRNPNCEKNPNPYDKEYDVIIDNLFKFDIKGTVVPKSMRGNVYDVIKDPRTMVDFYYDKQSRGRRYDIQNRLFIVHHSFIEPEREFYLRCAWQSKQHIYELFCQNIKNIKFYHTHNVKAGVIFILEKEKGKVEFEIPNLSK